VKAVLGIDVGTQGTKAGVYALDGTLVAHAYGEHSFTYPGPGWVEMDPHQIEEAVTSAVAQAVALAAARGVAAADIEGIALSGIVCGPVLIDEAWDPVRPIIPYLDMRARAEVEAMRALDPLWIEESGTDSLDTYVAPATLLWVRAHEPEVHARIARIVSLAPYIAGRLAGLRAADAFTDPTHLSGWIIGWDARRADFSPRQIEALGIDPAILPSVVPSTSVVGGLSADAARRTGLRAGIPIAAGAGDIMQSNLAAGQRQAGQATDVAGTASLITVSVPGLDPVISRIPGMLYSLGTIPGTGFYWGYVRAGGLSLRWFRDQVLGRPGDDALYAALDARAAAIPPGAQGVLFYPYLSGGGPVFGNAQGTWLGLAAGTDTDVLWRSLLESIAFEYDGFLRAFRARGLAIEEVLAVGGGSRSPLWNGIKADVTGIPWRVPARQDGAVLANAALAAVAAGLAPDLGALVAGWVALGDAARPDPERHAAYETIAAARRRLLDAPLRTVFDELHALRG
jgi:xylulokinase